MNSSTPHAVVDSSIRRARKPLMLVLAMIAIVLAWNTATANERAQSADEATRFVDQTTRDLLSSVEQGTDVAARVLETVTPHVDFERVSAWVLGRHWPGMNSDQRERFISEFRSLLAHTYAAAIKAYQNARIEYLPSRPTNRSDEALVRTRIVRSEGPQTQIDYRLQRIGDQWQVFDITVEGVSLVTSYRSEFASEIAKHGVDRLIDTLTRKNVSFQSG